MSMVDEVYDVSTVYRRCMKCMWCMMCQSCMRCKRCPWCMMRPSCMRFMSGAEVSMVDEVYVSIVYEV